MPERVDWVGAWTLEETFNAYDVEYDEDKVMVY